MQRVPSVRDIDKAWSVQNGKPVKREGKGLLLSAAPTATPPSTSTTMKRTPSAEELKLDSNDEETQRLKESINIDIDQVIGRWSDPKNINPIHDILSVQRLELYAHCLAEGLQISSTLSHGRALLPTLKQNGAVLLSIYSLLSAAILNKEAISPAAECFVDNWHIIEDQLAIVQQDLPKNYYYELPKLSTGVLRGYPRVYAISLIMVAYTDSLVDFDTLARFVQAYQRVNPLLIGELWAVAITLRIVLFEQLRLLAVRLGDTMTQLQRANRIADDLLTMVAKPSITASDIVHQLSFALGPQQELNRTLIVQLAQRLRDQDPIIRPAFTWLENQLSERYHTNTANVIQMDHHAQAADQVTIQNIISSMRMLNNINWIEFVEGASLVDEILKKDPARVYQRMDFPTRDHYRHAVERISKRSQATEFDVAQMVVDRSNEGKKDDRFDRRGHIGYWLVGDGLAEVEASVGYRPPLTERLHRFVKRYPTAIYLGALSFLTGLCMMPTFRYANSIGALQSWWAVLFFLWLSILPASELALCFLNHTITLLVKPKPLPCMNTEAGIPPTAKTMVVIPMLLTNMNGIGEIVENMEIHFLANQDENISFALLADYTDADSETTSDDRQLLSHAQQRVAALNHRYAGKEQGNRFYVFHRDRQWNPSEGKWMGWERKRGKIHEFNQLLRGATNTSYVDVEAPHSFLQQIKYVITLDSDTSLPRDAARRLIGVITHPLNAPHFDQQRGVVTEGYGIVQPRVSVDLASSFKSRFSQLYSNYIGIDAYHTSVSDVYQDLFGEGSFIGKGLYVVDMFLAATKDRVPENTILSHDLFEGLFVRSALVTEVELYDDHPSDWATFARRAHRWIRGDWQLTPWLFPRVPNEMRKMIPNRLSMVSWWKLFDNLRRSLVAPAQLFWMMLAWTLLPGSAVQWTLLVLMMFVFPVYALASSTLLQLWHQATAQSHPINFRLLFGKSWEQLKIKVAQFVLNISFLVEQSLDAIDAIGRTLYRLFISHKHMLEWTTSAQMEVLLKNGQPPKKLTQQGPVAAMVLSVLIFALHPSAFPVAFPFLCAWSLSPWIKIYLRGKSAATPPLTADQRATFRAYARRTWHFFETFVTEGEHFLAPDNYQLDPVPVIAHRTSPTNVGLELLAALAACDLGFIGQWQCLEWLERIFDTLAHLDRFNGHFFNWYDTASARPLLPTYISTVDSGNLAGHLLVVKQWCYEKLPAGTVPTSARDGILDTLVQLTKEISQVKSVSINAGGVTVQQLQDGVNQAIDLTKKTRSVSLTEWDDFLLSLSSTLSDAEDVLNALCLEPRVAEKLSQCSVWMALALKQVTELQRDVDLLSSPSSASIYKRRRDAIAEQCDEMFHAMDFKFLFDAQRKLFSIGFSCAEGRADHYHYDMLASESRLASFIAIAKGDVSQEHWFRMGRQLTQIGGGQALISWTASMFEYLMPLLIMRPYEDTLLHQTYLTVVNRQIEYGKIQNVPWGISEAGYNARDLQMSYQYGPFGVPGLGLKRGLSEDLVVSPYSTMLAAQVDPIAALFNLRQLETLSAFNRFGFYESIDYTLKRLPSKESRYVLKSYMAHHQGMSVVALDNVLNDGIMQTRFHRDPIVQATELLLQERIPTDANLSLPRADEVRLEGTSYFFSSHPNPRVYTDPSLPTPRTQLLSNGKYSVMVTSCGSGYSRCEQMAVSRWREDTTRDNWGHFCYLRDRTSNAIWSCGFQPLGTKPDEYEVTFAEDKVEIVRVDHDIVSHTEIIVATTDNVELRRISLTNHSEVERRIEVTSFQEIVLAPPAEDNAHTTFSNLFVQTEFDPNKSCLLATRRQRAPGKPPVWAFHVVVVEGDSIGSIQYETDRARFIGRGRSPANPFVLHNQGQPLSNSVGSVLDPCLTGDHMVLTRSGWRSIKQMRVGDLVMSLNVDTREMEWKPVTRLIAKSRNETQSNHGLYRMEGSGMDVVATRDHRLLLARVNNRRLQSGQPIVFETVRDALKLKYRRDDGSRHSQFEHTKVRAVLRAGLNHQPAVKIVIPGLEAVCEWWWTKDKQIAFLKFLGFWLGDGSLRVRLGCGQVQIAQRRLKSSAWLIDLLDAVFPRWWHRSLTGEEKKGATVRYTVRCPPLFDWLRVMAAGPIGYNPRDPSALRNYPHFVKEAELANKENQSPYRQPSNKLGAWTQDEMLAALTAGPVRRTCLACCCGGGEMLVCCGAACRRVGRITRAHPACVRATFERAWFCPACDESPSVASTTCSAASISTPTLASRSTSTLAEDDARAAATAYFDESVDVDASASSAADTSAATGSPPPSPPAAGAADDSDDEDDQGQCIAALDEKAAQELQAVGAIVWWNNGLWIIINGQWFCLKRWLGAANMANMFSRLSREQAVALLDGFCRADGTYEYVQYDEETGRPKGTWMCSNSSLPLIDHLQLVAQLAEASVTLSRHSRAGKTTQIDGRTVKCSTDHWKLSLSFSKWKHLPVQATYLAQPVDVSDDVDARGNYEYRDDGKVYCIDVKDNENFLTQRLSLKRLQSSGGGLGVRAQPVFIGNCFSLRQSVLIPSGGIVRVTFSTGITNSRDEAISFADKYQDPHLFAREAAMVWTQSQVQLRHLNIDTDKAHLYQRLAGRVLYSDSSLRPHARLLSSNTRVQANLWPYGISGDLPIILTGINDEKDMQIIRDVLHAHEYLRLKGVATDLVILNEHPPSYVQMLQDEIQRQISMSASSSLLDKKGGVYVRRSDIMPKEDVILLKSIARVYLRADQGTLEEQTKRRPVEVMQSPPLVVSSKPPRRESKILLLPPVLPMAELSRQLSRQSSAASDLIYFNGLGGFTHDGREYVITLVDEQWTPAPWVNVMANANNFGCICSESGSGYTWAVNSRENRLTPWSNDPIQDTAGEAIYIRDELTGEFWCPTPLPIREAERYTVRHGAGYTSISHNSHGIAQQVRVFIPKADTGMDADIKITELALTNGTSQPRHLSVTSYVEWVLGISRAASAPAVVTEIDGVSRAIFATNPYNNEFNSRVAFADMVSEGGGEKSVTCDRTEFLGRNGSAAAPAAMLRVRLSANAGAGLDPCAAFRWVFHLAPGETRRVIVQLGEADNAAHAKRIMSQYQHPQQVDAALAAVIDYWDDLLSAIAIKTPETSMNILVNRWLLYQTLSCRLWARSAFYQSGGAYGFRDQLQDVMACVYAEPQVTRDQILRAAGRQFPEGDVQHWWHPPTGRGVRTHCSDDALFLPFVLSFYIHVTGDRTILGEKAPFIRQPQLQPGQEDSYNLPQVDTESSVSVLEHAIRVADRYMQGGAHNLPFIGSCDWNDGFNMVGHDGKGESVWLAWFLYLTLGQFSALLDTCDGKHAQAEAYRARMQSLKQACEEHGWDGEWYRRAFFDDGTPLGSAKCDECQIDSLAQSWAVLSGAGEPRHAKQAMDSADNQLVSREAGLIKLFTPPFDKSTMNPGYIKGYVPGVRENGGQYTHAAVWMVLGFAQLGDGDRAVELFNMLNPINHTTNRAGVQRYKVEPYVMAADVYGRAPHVGRGGWTWYTGSSSWMYRAAVEAILGFDLRAGVLRLNPRIPQGWAGFELTYRKKAARLGTGGAVRTRGGEYRIVVTNDSHRNGQVTRGEPVYELDGQVLREPFITLPDDGQIHSIRIQL